MSSFSDHPRKRVIREQWCKPLLQYIHDTLGFGLVYLGLPGEKLLDIRCWLEYLNQVIAFDCGDYINEPPDPLVVEKTLKAIRDELNTLERKKDIETFSLYNGFIEKVVLRGIDEDGQKYAQKETVTVYNLDFCNSLTHPIEVTDTSGKTRKYFKREVIEKLIDTQGRLAEKTGNARFVMFLTVNSLFFESEAKWILKGKRFVSGKEKGRYKKYIDTLKGLNDDEKKIRLLKSYTFGILRQCFANAGIVSDILPSIYYQGSGSSKLVCFTVVGTFQKRGKLCLPHQDYLEMLSKKFLKANNSKMFEYKLKDFDETTVSADPIACFAETETYKSLW